MIIEKKGSPVVQAEHADNPPAYESHATDRNVPSTSSPISASGLAFGAPTNFLQVQNTYNNVRGAWTIDTSLEIPASLLAPIPEELNTRPNAWIQTPYGNIIADFKIAGNQTERATIYATSSYGNIKLNVHERFNQRIYLKAKCEYGNTVIRIPRDFTGIIQNKTSHGNVVFSSEVQSRLSTSSGAKDGTTRSFLGDFNSAGYSGEDGRSWEGDELEIKSNFGNVKISYIDEPDLTSKAHSFLAKLFGSSK